MEIPDSNLMGIFEPRPITAQDPVDEDGIMRAAFADPIGIPPLEDLVDPKMEIVIVADDNTRVTPLRKIMPLVLRRLLDGGASRDRIRIVVGLGTHRPMTRAEMVQKFGREILKQYQVINHNCHNLQDLVNLGHTENGTKILVNRYVFEADLLIGLGHIVPHGVSGFSGGGKIVQPGVCGMATTGQTHWLSAQYPGTEIIGIRDNPVRVEIDAVARKVGLDLIVNSIQNPDGRIVALVVGDMEQAHRRGCEIATEVFGVRIPEPADIVLTDSRPAEMDLWQAAKGFYSAEPVVKEGGVVILMAPCSEGIAPSHPEVFENGYLSLAEASERVEKGQIKNLVAAAHLVHVGRLVREKAQGILVSPGVDREEAEKMGLLYAETVEDALKQAFRILGSDARVAVLRKGGEILPMVRTA